MQRQTKDWFVPATRKSLGKVGWAPSCAYINETMAARQGNVAIKLIHPNYAQHPEEEHDSLQDINWTKIKSFRLYVFWLIEEQNQLGLVMEVRRKSLSELIGTDVGPIPWPQARGYFFKILDAVEYARKMGWFTGYQT